jgi:acyl-CoA synthetase
MKKLDQKWVFKAEEAIFSNACVVNENNLVLFGCHDSHLYCLDQTSGALKWKFNFSSQIYGAPFQIGSDRIACVSSNSLIAVFSLDEGKSLLEKTLFTGENSCFSSPLVYKNKLLLGSRDNFLYSFKFV